MKKAILITLISALAITMTACGNVDEETPSKAETTVKTTVKTTVTTVLEETETTTSVSSSSKISKTSTTKKATTSTSKKNNKSSAGDNSGNNSNNTNNYSGGNSSGNNSSGNSYSSNNNSGNSSGSQNSGGSKGSNSNNQPKQTNAPAPAATTKKPAQTQSPAPVKQNHLTQSDMDNLKNELQEYSNSKYCNLNGISNVNQASWYAWSDSNGNIVDYVTDSIAQCDFNSYLYIMNPNWCGYDDIEPILYEPDSNYWVMDATTSYNELLNSMKSDIDYEYSERPDAHYVVYIENCPNGKDVDGFYYPPCWVIYLLY